MNHDFFIGLPNSRYELNKFVVTGIAPSITSNRISYYFDLRGPTITLDTACSCALVAVHLGCQSIRSGKCSFCCYVRIEKTKIKFSKKFSFKHVLQKIDKTSTSFFIKRFYYC